MANVILMYSRHHASRRHVAALERVFGAGEVLEVSCPEHAIQSAPRARVIFGHRYLRQVLPKAESLSWVQISSAGYDHLPVEELRRRKVVVSRATVASDVIAQHAVMMGLALNRRLPSILDYQRHRTWGDDLYGSMPPQPRRALVLGFGPIGSSIGRILSAASIHVTAVARRDSPELHGKGVSFVTDDSWRRIADSFDMVFLALPNNNSTKSIVDRHFIEGLPSHAVIVNVGRAETMDLPSITEQLMTGGLGGAALDVPPGRTPIEVVSSLWDVPNLIISPYLAARYKNRWDDLERFFEAQAERWQANAPLKNVVA